MTLVSSSRKLTKPGFAPKSGFFNGRLDFCLSKLSNHWKPPLGRTCVEPYFQSSWWKRATDRGYFVGDF